MESNGHGWRFEALHRAYLSLCTPQVRKIWQSKGIYQACRDVEESGKVLCRYHLQLELQYTCEDVSLTLHEIHKQSGVQAADRQCSFGHFVQAAWNVKESPDSAERAVNRARAWVEILHTKSNLRGNGFLSFDCLEGVCDATSEWNVFFFAVKTHPSLGLPETSTPQGLLAMALSAGACGGESDGCKEISACEAFIAWNAAMHDPDTLAKESLRPSNLADVFQCPGSAGKGSLPQLSA
jgi:hypothetical protein